MRLSLSYDIIIVTYLR